MSFEEKTESNILKYIASYSNHIYEFTNGWCYSFASILEHKFNGEIYYLPIMNHFICKIGEKYYDVTGELNPNNLGESPYKWNSYRKRDKSETNRIIRDCIFKDR